MWTSGVCICFLIQKFKFSLSWKCDCTTLLIFFQPCKHSCFSTKMSYTNSKNTYAYRTQYLLTKTLIFTLFWNNGWLMTSSTIYLFNLKISSYFSSPQPSFSFPQALLTILQSGHCVSAYLPLYIGLGPLLFCVVSCTFIVYLPPDFTTKLILYMAAEFLKSKS